MNKDLSNKFSAYKSVKGVLEENPGIFEGVPMAAQAVLEFYGVLEEINKVATIVAFDTTGETQAKKLAKERMAFVASSLAASGAVYAVDCADEELEASLDYTYSDIKYGLDNEALQMARAIKSILQQRRKKLTGYMVNRQDLEELHLRIEVYNDALESRGGAKSGAVAWNKELSLLFQSADDLLERKLDRFVFRLKEQSPDFYVAYHNARLIADL